MLLLCDTSGQQHGRIAASAELSGLHVPHLAKVFATIAALTGQPTTRLECVVGN
ncbi:MAG: hypothetical protein KDB71_00215 [Mycobacterium sp.]|nr:hypothetical protein [Mycobacterium sp.]